MVTGNSVIKRTYIGKDFQDVMELPDLIDIQLSSYERFLQRERLRRGEAPEMQDWKKPLGQPFL
jgi:DNA-directed RNA polymerase subunit beta